MIPFWIKIEIFAKLCQMAELGLKGLIFLKENRVLFENRPALYFCNFIFITANKIYIFDSVSKILFKFVMYKSQKFDLIVILMIEILLHNICL